MSGLRQRAIASSTVSPRLPRHVRLHFDPVRQAWALLSPEKVLWPDETSLAILRHCDGATPLARITERLAAEYGAEPADIEADVLGFVQDWADRMVLRL